MMCVHVCNLVPKYTCSIFYIQKLQMYSVIYLRFCRVSRSEISSKAYNVFNLSVNGWFWHCAWDNMKTRFLIPVFYGVQ